MTAKKIGNLVFECATQNQYRASREWMDGIEVLDVMPAAAPNDDWIWSAYQVGVSFFKDRLLDYYVEGRADTRDEAMRAAIKSRKKWVKDASDFAALKK